MFAIQREDVIGFIKQNGPSVANDLRKKFKVESFIVGAVLSEMTSNGVLKITKMKNGSSPFYYLPGQENQLEHLIQFLNSKDRDTAKWLKDKKVVADANLEVLKRVSLRKINDFAIPLKAKTAAGNEILFWRFYSFPEDEAIKFLKNGGEKTEKEIISPQANDIKPIEEKTQDIDSEGFKEQLEKPTSDEKTNEEKPIQKKLSQKDEDLISKQNTTDLKLKKQIAKEIHSESKSPAPDFTPTTFYKKCKEYFDENEIIIIRQDEIGKKEYEFLVKIDSTIGKIPILIRAKDKKKLNEGDVAPGLLSAKMLDVNCLFLTTGSFTKKAQETLEKLYTGLIVRHF